MIWENTKNRTLKCNTQNYVQNDLDIFQMNRHYVFEHIGKRLEGNILTFDSVYR